MNAHFIIIGITESLLNTEAYSELCPTAKMKRFAKIANSEKPLTIFAKPSILDV